MPQFRDFTAAISTTDTDVTIRSQIGSFQIGATVLRDGSVETNFKAAMWAHFQAVLEQPPSATSIPCTVATKGKWNKVAASGSMTTPATIIYKPGTNSGKLNLFRDAGSFTMNYILNGGSPTSFTDGTQITIADGDTLAFSVSSLGSQEGASGSVEDDDTGIALGDIGFYNTTP